MSRVHARVVDVQSRIFENGLRRADILKQAKVARSTWARWANGAKPSLRLLDKIEEAIDAALEQQEAI